MMAFRMVRGGYQARANVEERTMLASLARDVVLLLGSALLVTRRRDA